MKDQSYERARLAGRVRIIGQELLDVADALSDLKLFNCSGDAFETAGDLFNLNRELLELPRLASSAPPYEHDPGRLEDVPF